MSGTQTERQFVSTYLQLINLSTDTKYDQFNSPSDYSRLQSLGPSLPKIEVKLPRQTDAARKEKAVVLNFKSIKPPYKIATQLSNIPVSTTVYKVKSDLISSLPLLKESNITPVNLKLLVKGKVIQDTSSLASLPNIGNELSFMVMVSPPALTPSNADSNRNTDAQSQKENYNETDPDIIAPIFITEGTWKKIYNVLKDDLKSEDKANEALTKLQSAWN